MNDDEVTNRPGRLVEIELLFGASSRRTREPDMDVSDVDVTDMNVASALPRQGHRLLQIGVALFLFASFEGFTIPYLAVPLLGRSAHSLSALLGVMLISLGLVWPKLKFGEIASRIAFWFLIYSGLAITAAFIIAAVWGASKSTMPLAGAPAGTSIQELVIVIVAYSSAPTGIVSFALILWGLRLVPARP